MKILIVDDSKSMRMLVSLHLQRAGFKGHTLFEASDGLEALDLIRVNKPDVVLSDWNMPNLTGIELLKKLNEQFELEEIEKMPAFVFVTTEATQTMLQTALDNGAKTLITKPFSVETFENKLSKIIY